MRFLLGVHLSCRQERTQRLWLDFLPERIRRDYVLHEVHHACAVLRHDFPDEWTDLVEALERLRLPRSQILAKGGNKSPISRGINGFFYDRKWAEKKFQIQVTVDGQVTLAPTHHVDYFRNRVAIETEWNNKDPFFDRDLTTFRLLFDLNVLSVGVIITRADELQKIFNQLGKGASYGQNTTHMSQLIGRLNNRGPGGCPVLAVGMTGRIYDEKG